MEHIKDCIAALREAAPEIDIAENELMRRHTTFAIGGPADLFVQPKTRRELTAALAVLRERNIPFLLLGNGSNTLFDDAGFDGAVIDMRGLSVLHNIHITDKLAILTDREMQRCDLLAVKLGKLLYYLTIADIVHVHICYKNHTR